MKLSAYSLIAFGAILAAFVFYAAPSANAQPSMSSILGMDKDRNGVRDDVDSYINTNFASSQKQRVALTNIARALQKGLAAHKSHKMARSASIELDKATVCLLDIIGKDETVTANMMHQDLVTAILDTRERQDAYIAFDNLVNMEKNPDLAKDFGDSCSFNPDALPN